MIQESIERMNELIDILNDANYNYYVKDNPTITDQEFDKYLRELETIEKNHPEWKRNDKMYSRMSRYSWDHTIIYKSVIPRH